MNKSQMHTFNKLFNSSPNQQVEKYDFNSIISQSFDTQRACQNQMEELERTMRTKRSNKNFMKNTGKLYNSTEHSPVGFKEHSPIHYVDQNLTQLSLVDSALKAEVDSAKAWNLQETNRLADMRYSYKINQAKKNNLG